MTRIYALSLCLLATVSTFAAGFTKDQELRPATAEELALKDVSYAPGASAVVLDWVEVDNDPLSVASEYYRIKILTEEGRKYADVEIPYIAGFPYNGRITDVDARTIQPDGRIVPFNGKIYDKVLLKAGGVRLRAKAFSLPEVQPGSILEYRYQRRWADHLLLNTNWVIQRDIPVLRARMSMEPYNSQGQYQSFFTYYNLPAGKVPTLSKRKTYDLELTNVPVFPNEDFAPPEDSMKMSVRFYYTDAQVEASKFWKDQTASWNKTIEGFIGKPDALRAQAQPLLGKDQAETLKNVYAKVQTFRNLSFEDETQADDKKNAAAVVTKAEGYRREITRAFVALARAAGLEANVIRVASRDRFFFSPNVTDAEQMDGEIAAVTIGGQTQYFDPGTPTAPFGIVSWEKSSVPGVRIAKGAEAVFNTVADQTTDQAVSRRTADLRLNGDVLEGSVTATFSGQEALRRRLRTWGEDEATRTKDLEDEAKRWFPDGATVKLTQVTGDKTHAEPLVVKYDVKLPGLVSEAGSRTVLPMSIFEANAKNPFSSATRTHPIYFPYRNREEDEVKVTLPENLSLAALPKATPLNGGVLQYTNEVLQNGSEVTLKRRLNVDAMLIDQEYYKALRNFFSAMVAADQKPLVLVSK